MEKIKKIFWSLLLSVMVIISVIGVGASKAMADTQSSIESISVVYPDQKDGIVATKDWATVNLQLNINSLKKGETIKLSLEKADYSYSKEAFTVGDVLVTPNTDGTWTLTAQDDINSGNLNLNLKLRYSTNVEKDFTDKVKFSLKQKDSTSEKNVNINILKYTEKVNAKELVRKVPLGFTKEGKIAWVIYFNYNQATLSGTEKTTFDFKDTVGVNQELDVDSISAYNVKNPIVKDSSGNEIRNTNHDDYNYDVSQFLQKIANKQGFDDDNKSYNLPGSNGKAYYIYLETTPKDTDPSAVYTNYTYMRTASEGDKAWEDEDMAVISKDESSSGNTAGSVTLLKKDSDTDQVLKGAKFDLINEDTNKTIQKDLETDSQGKISVYGLSVGKYAFVETKAPTDYEISSKKVEFEITSNSVNTIQVTAYNKKIDQKNGSIKIVKEDKDTKVKLAGAVFEWKDTSNGYTAHITTGANGEATIAGLSVNRTYEVKEITAPKGYELDSTVHKVTLSQDDANKTVTVNVADVAQKGSIKIVKQDKCTGATLSGAVFEWKDTSNGYTGRVTTGADGSVTIAGLSVNRTYEIKEITAPKGYELDSTVHKVTLTQDDANKTVSVTVKDVAQKGSIKIVKEDKDTKAKLAGAVFEWKDTSNGYTAHITTGANGEATIAGLSVNRTYEVKEITAPKGYELDSTVHKVTLTQDDANKTVAVTVKDVAQKGSIKIVKQDKCTGATLSGAVFEWKDTSNGYTGRVTTGADGSVTISGLSLNRTYEIKEITAPKGYELDSTVHSVTLTQNDGDKTVTVTVKDVAQKGSIKIIKQDKDSKEKLAGAVFEWKDTTNGYTGRVTTGADGTVTIPGLSVNRKYEIKEVVAPDKYELNQTVYTVDLTTDKVNQVVAVTVDDKALEDGKICIRVVSSNGEGVAGFVYEFTDTVTGYKWIKTTDANGYVKLNGLSRNRIYKYRQIGAPEGQTFDPNVYEKHL